MTRVTVIIVSYNTKEILASCLRALGKSFDTIVVDNASTDGSPQMVQEQFPYVILIKNKKNHGFAKANNQGIKKANSTYVLLLNSDTEASSDVVTKMCDFMDTHPKAAAATCKLMLPTGKMDPACHRGFPTPWASFTYLTGLEKLFPTTRMFSQYHMGYEDLNTPHKVDVISGAFFLVRKSAIVDVGLLDEDYFFYAEDIDWAYRMKQKGWEIWFNPAVSALHIKKQSGRGSADRQRKIASDIYFHTSNWLFYKKHYQKKYGPLITLGVSMFYSCRLFLLRRLHI